jgi:putative flippase GtrA
MSTYVASAGARLINLATPRQFSTWFGLGVLAFGAEIAVLVVLQEYLQCPLWLSSAIAAEGVLVARFVTTDRFVFGHPRPTLGRCWRYHSAAAGAFAISWLVLNGSAATLGVPYVAATFLGTVAAFGWSALTNFLWVWRRPALSAA